MVANARLVVVVSGSAQGLPLRGILIGSVAGGLIAQLLFASTELG